MLQLEIQKLGICAHVWVWHIGTVMIYKAMEWF